MKKVRLSRMVAALPLVALAACQPQLHTHLPSGAAAYATIDPAIDEQGDSYLLSPGDIVTVDVFQEPDLTLENIAIDSSGHLFLPLIGQVQAGGRSTAQLSQDIQQAYAKGYLRDPRVAVVVKQSISNVLSVEGEVAKPGVYPIQPGATLLTAMALAGSPAKTAKLNQVLVFRTVNGQRLGARFDLTDIRSGKAADPQMLPGDVIVVGFSAVRGAYRDLLDAAPLFNVFTRF